jgi:hypothetical protein
MKVSDLRKAIENLADDEEVFIIDADTDWHLNLKHIGFANKGENPYNFYYEASETGLYLWSSYYGD